MAKLKKENKALLELVGEITMKLSTTQKRIEDKEFFDKDSVSQSNRHIQNPPLLSPQVAGKNWGIKQLIELALREHPAYGHKRLAGHLNINKKRILRVMKIFSIKPYRRRGRKWRAANRNSVFFPNLLLVKRPTWPNHVWASDFTHISFHGKTLFYLATVIDLSQEK